MAYAEFFLGKGYEQTRLSPEENGFPDDLTAWIPENACDWRGSWYDLAGETYEDLDSQALVKADKLTYEDRVILQAQGIILQETEDGRFYIFYQKAKLEELLGKPLETEIVSIPGYSHDATGAYDA